MATTVILHIKNTEAVVAEVDDLPQPTDLTITVKLPHCGWQGFAFPDG